MLDRYGVALQVHSSQVFMEYQLCARYSASARDGTLTETKPSYGPNILGDRRERERERETINNNYGLLGSKKHYR